MYCTSDKLVTNHCYNPRKMVLFHHMKFKVALSFLFFFFKLNMLFLQQQ